VRQLFSTASLVAKGEVLSVVEVDHKVGAAAATPARLDEFAAVVRIDRIYKGNGEVPNTRITITFRRPPEPACTVTPCISLSKGDYDLFFLASKDDHFELIDRFFGKFVSSRLVGASDKQGLEQLETDLLTGLRDPNETVVLQHIELLGSLERVSSIAPLIDLSSSPDRKIQTAACIALTRLNEFSKLESCGRLFEQASDDPRMQMLQSRLSFYVAQVHDRSAIPGLLKIAHSQSDQLRESVIHALREMPSAETVPILVAALDDHVKLIRYDAVYGLASIEQNWDLAPSVSAFDRAEPKYINAWKTWWMETGRTKYRQNRVH
jgi:hypothetical protein